MTTTNDTDRGTGAKETLGSRLERCLKEKRLSQAELARIAGVRQQTVNYLIQSGATSSSYAIRIAAALGVNPAWLQDGVGNPHDPTALVSSGPGVSMVQARWVPRIKMFQQLEKFLNEGTDTAEDADLVVTTAQVSGRAFCMEVEGRSMEKGDDGFRQGDEIICDPMVSAEPGDYVVAAVGNVLMLRKYRSLTPMHLGQPRFELVPLNPDFASVSSDDGNVAVVGAVVEHRRRFRKAA